MVPTQNAAKLSTVPDAGTPITCSPIPIIANPVVSRLKASGHAQIIKARNTHDIATVMTLAPARPPGRNPFRPPVTYQSTGVQTLPPRDAHCFHKIQGRDPTHQETERKIGLAAYGRYMGEPGANPHDVVYGAAFQQELHAQKPTYTDSSFQTVDAAARKKALAKAKVKASMTANKYKKLAAEDGYDIWAEAKDENIIHSEQCSVTVKLNSEGNAEDGEDLTGRLLPNIWKEERQVERQVRETPRIALRPPDPLPMTRNNVTPSITLQVSTPPMTPLMSYKPEGKIALQQIAAVEPSLREITENMAMSEEYSDTESYEEDLHRSSAYATDDDAYVVYDAGSSPSTPPSQATAIALESSRKRKGSHKDGSKDREFKRSRISAPKDQNVRSGDRPKVEARCREKCQRSQDRGRSSVYPRVSSRETSYRSETPIRQPNQPSRSIEARYNTRRSERRSRSPERRPNLDAPQARRRSRPIPMDKERRHNLDKKVGHARRSNHRSKSPARTEERRHTLVEKVIEASDLCTKSGIKQDTTNEERSIQSAAAVKNSPRVRRQSRSPAPNSLRNGTNARETRQRDYDTRRSARNDESAAAIPSAGSSHTSRSPSVRHMTEVGTTAQHTLAPSNSGQEGAQTRPNRIASQTPRPAVSENVLASHITAGTLLHVDRLRTDHAREMETPKHEEHNVRKQEKSTEANTSLRRVHEARASIAQEVARPSKKEARTTVPPKKQRDHTQEKNAVSKQSRTDAKLREAPKNDRKPETKLIQKAKEVEKVDKVTLDNQKKNPTADEEKRRVAEIERKKKTVYAEQKSLTDEAEKRKAEVKARIAERHASRGPRLDLQRYVPRALREADQGDATGGNRSNSNNRKDERKEGRGRRP
jgi:hypothetical protein